jgi:hypothetical protein
MEELRQHRIAFINSLSLEDANDNLRLVQEKLEALNHETFPGSIPHSLLLETHLAYDDRVLIEKRITSLLDQELDDYHAQGAIQSWNKADACKLLRDTLDKNLLTIPVSRLFEIVTSSTDDLSNANERKKVIFDFAVILEEFGYTTRDQSISILNGYDLN